ncbi:DUF4166 domain-containing protein [Microbacterium lacticum]|uniref:DUF4166 domain-containing protein n=1 Tax=Microbacterium lacticum TaxID=33885 RepID=UPI001F55CC87|nr:DUF4166 domain-containing protein [Microbacterium lacticum]
MYRESVYERVLGDRIDKLDAGLRRYFGALPEGCVGVGHGVFEVAGSRVRVLWPVWRFLAWRGVLLPERGCDVPFSVVNTAHADGSLTAARTVRFGARRRVMVDRMSVERRALVDRIGRRGGLEVALDVRVEGGALRLQSRRIALRLRRVRVPLGRLAEVTVIERAAPAPAGGEGDTAADAPRQAVDVRIRMPLLGEVFRYAGTFTYSAFAGDTATDDIAPRAQERPGREASSAGATTSS